jgi:hypothetical protein
MLTNLNEFLLSANSDNRPSNETILSNINLLSAEDSEYAEKLTRELTNLCIVRPLIVKSIKMAKTLAWRTYIDDNNVSKTNSTMANVIKLLDKSEINLWTLELYEEGSLNVRNFVHRVNALSGYNKVPYLHILLKSLNKKINSTKKLKTKQDVKNLFDNPELVPQLETWIAADEVKRYSGETVTNPNIYSWVVKQFPLDTQAIQSAEIGYDLGGGFATPGISILFNKPMVSLDVIDPSNNSDVILSVPELTTLAEYRDLLAQQPYIRFDVFADDFPDNYNSYFITSFGFATSTVSYTGNETVAGAAWVNTTYNSMKRLANLIAKNKDVYFLLYGRPTNRIHRNKVIAMRFNNRVMQSVEIYEDNYSTKNDHSFGITHVLF